MAGPNPTIHGDYHVVQFLRFSHLLQAWEVLSRKNIKQHWREVGAFPLFAFFVFLEHVLRVFGGVFQCSGTPETS